MLHHLVPLWRVLRPLKRLCQVVPFLDFARIHYLYFVIVSLVSSGVLYGISTPAQSLSYPDALFLAVSAITEAGLNTVNLSSLNTAQQAILFALIFTGSAIFVSSVLVFVRLLAFEQEFEDALARRRALDLSSERGHIRCASATSSLDGSLSDAKRQQLGGREYSAVRMLAWIVPLYILLFQLIAAVGVGAWLATHRWGTAEGNGINPWWLGAFNVVSAFNNSGMSLLDTNMTALYDAPYVLLTMAMLILIGNTAYPCLLRFAIWTLWKILPGSPQWHEQKATLRFLLDYPRRCYTNLFPSKPTWYLLATVVTLNAVDWLAFCVLKNGAIENFTGRYLVLDGLFQALAVRSGGFYVIPIANSKAALQVLYVIMMFICVYPVTMTMRDTNIYEERSMAIFREDIDAGYASKSGAQTTAYRVSSPRPAGWLSGMAAKASKFTNPERTWPFFMRQLRSQLSHDAWIVALAVFCICIIENDRIAADPRDFSVFNIVFEVVSGYGCVGISVGVPNDNYSFSGSWQVLSKLILCAVMLAGRHRGLPVALDHAVQLPGEPRDGLIEERD